MSVVPGTIESLAEVMMYWQDSPSAPLMIVRPGSASELTRANARAPRLRRLLRPDEVLGGAPGMTAATKTMFTTQTNVQEIQLRSFGQADGAARFFFINATYGRGTGLRRGLSVGVTPGARVGVGVAVGVVLGVIGGSLGVGTELQKISIVLNGVPSL